MIKIAILGAGAVAQHLYQAFDQISEIQLETGYNRSFSPALAAKGFAHVSNIHKIGKADLYIIAVTDDAVSSVASALPYKNALLLHTSGSKPLLETTIAKRSGVFYPLQTFTAHQKPDFSKIPISLETRMAEDMPLLKTLVKLLRAPHYEINSAQRNQLHIAAVFANNFGNLMLTLAEEICTKNQIPFDILHPLLLETASKASQKSPRTNQTGPAMRNDQTTIQRHINNLSSDKMKQLYTILTNTIQDIHGKKL